MPGSNSRSDSARNSPTERDIAAFVDARQSAGARRGARAIRLRVPVLSPAVRAVLITALAWVGIAQWLGWVIRLLRFSVEG